MLIVNHGASKNERAVKYTLYALDLSKKDRHPASLETRRYARGCPILAEIPSSLWLPGVEIGLPFTVRLPEDSGSPDEAANVFPIG